MASKLFNRPRLWALVGAALILSAGAACDDSDSGGNGTNNGGEDVSNNDDVGSDTGTPDAAEDVGEDVGDDAPDESGLSIEPADAVIELTLGGMDGIDFNLFDTAEDGSREEVTGVVVWDLSSLQVGPINANTGEFQTSGNAGLVDVIATHDGQTVMTTLTVRIVDTVLGDDSLPGDLDAFTGAAGNSPDLAPMIVYPEDGTLFPQNIRGVTIQWNDRGQQLFRVRFTSNELDLAVVTRSSILSPNNDLWTTLARSTLEGQVTVTVEGTTGPGGIIETSESINIRFSPDSVTGAIYYWSTADAGLVRLPVGDTAPELFYAPGNPAGAPCVGCHALSRDGSRIAFNTGPIGLPIGPFMEVPTDNPGSPIVDQGQMIDGMQPTFSPEGDRIVTGWNGVLTERNANGTCADDPNIPCVNDTQCGTTCNTGQALGTIPLPPGIKGGFPDWAPDDSALVAIGTTFGIPVGFDFSTPPESGLVLVPRQMDGWGTPEIILEADTIDDTNGHPAYSPDSRWIAFDHLGSGLVNVNGNRIQSQLWLISPETRIPVPLSRANQRDGLNNNWPKWSPTDGQHLWLAFSSTRRYGNVDTENQPQIWITGIDPAFAERGADPSFPAFWMPYQNPVSGNHIPYWAVFEKEPEKEE